MDQRIRRLHDQVKAACPESESRNVRFHTPAPRRSYMLLRVEGVDALNVSQLCARNQDCLMFMRSIGGGAALDVYVPMGRTPAESALRAATRAAFVGAAAAAGLAIWTMAATRR